MESIEPEEPNPLNQFLARRLRFLKAWDEVERWRVPLANRGTSHGSAGSDPGVFTQKEGTRAFTPIRIDIEREER